MDEEQKLLITVAGNIAGHLAPVVDEWLGHDIQEVKTARELARVSVMLAREVIAAAGAA